MLIPKNSREVAAIENAQDEILIRLDPVLSKYPEIWLSGGTVLAREWLNHRVSFDLDFFVPPSFDLQGLAKELKPYGFSVERALFEKDIYQQLFGRIAINGTSIEVSFIQDRLHHLFEPVKSKVFPEEIMVEKPEQIYQRKTSIIIGLSEAYGNGRSKARDVFDLYVLSRKLMPVREFVSKTWNERLLENFLEGIGNLDAMQIITDTQYYVFPEWMEADTGDKAYWLLLKECGIQMPDLDMAFQEDDETNGPER